MFSEKDRAIMFHIRSILSQNGKMPEYYEKSNAIIHTIKKESDFYPLFIRCRDNVLSIFSLKNIDGVKCSEDVLKYILDLNYKMRMGGFCYFMEKDSIVYKLSVPLYEKPENEFLTSLIVYTVDILEDKMPKILSKIHE